MNATDVREELGRLLGSPGFDASARNRRFLEYIVEETLAGRADRLKGTSIAIDVFGRDATIDPQHDPVVRIEAAKLRRRLERYFLTAGREDPVRIDIPKGGYVPTFERREPALPDPAAVAPAGERAAAAAATQARGNVRSRWLWLATGLLAGSLLGALGWFGADLAPRSWSGSRGDAVVDLPHGPKIAVLPFLNLSGDPGQAYFAEGVTDQLVTDLARFKDILFVLSIGSTAKYRNGRLIPNASNASSASIICWTAAFDARRTDSNSRPVWSMPGPARSSGPRPIAMSSRRPMSRKFKTMSRRRCRQPSPATTV